MMAVTLFVQAPIQAEAGFKERAKDAWNSFKDSGDGKFTKGKSKKFSLKKLRKGKGKKLSLKKFKGGKKFGGKKFSLKKLKGKTSGKFKIGNLSRNKLKAIGKGCEPGENWSKRKGCY